MPTHRYEVRRGDEVYDAGSDYRLACREWDRRVDEAKGEVLLVAVHIDTGAERVERRGG